MWWWKTTTTTSKTSSRHDDNQQQQQQKQKHQRRRIRPVSVSEVSPSSDLTPRLPHYQQQQQHKYHHNDDDNDDDKQKYDVPVVESLYSVMPTTTTTRPDCFNSNSSSSNNARRRDNNSLTRRPMTHLCLSLKLYHYVNSKRNTNTKTKGTKKNRFIFRLMIILICVIVSCLYMYLFYDHNHSVVIYDHIESIQSHWNILSQQIVEIPTTPTTSMTKWSGIPEFDPVQQTIFGSSSIQQPTTTTTTTTATKEHIHVTTKNMNDNNPIPTESLHFMGTTTEIIDIDDHVDILPIYQPDHQTCKISSTSAPINIYQSSRVTTGGDDGGGVDDTARGIYHIQMGDIGGAAATIFFQFVIDQILYAELHNLIPYVHFNNVSHIIYDPIVHGNSNSNNNNNNNSNQVEFVPPTTSNTTVLPNLLVGMVAQYDQPFGRMGHWRDYRPGELILNETQTKLMNLTLHGTGVWNHYFLPVSSYVPGDSSCYNHEYVTLDLYLITPGLHGFAEYTPKCWRYPYLPDYVTKPHIPVTEWLEPFRYTAHRVMKQYIHFRPYLLRSAHVVNPNCNPITTPCLGLHIRHSDKAAGRIILPVAAFLPYVETFLQVIQQQQQNQQHNQSKIHMGYIYLATDSSIVLNEIESTWPLYVRQQIRTLGPNVVRSTNSVPVFDLVTIPSGGTNTTSTATTTTTTSSSSGGGGEIQVRGGHHRTNIEVLTDIIALSTCQFMIHGFSAVSESTIWYNINLHNTSVNLEDPDHINTTQFHQLVSYVLQTPDNNNNNNSNDNNNTDQQNQQPHENGSHSGIENVGNMNLSTTPLLLPPTAPILPRPMRTTDIWPELHEQIELGRQIQQQNEDITTPTHIDEIQVDIANDICHGYVGVLRISGVGRTHAAGMAFFHSILNQLLYAEKYNLLPWIHLQEDRSLLIYDPVVHSGTNNSNLTFTMLRGLEPTVHNLPNNERGHRSQQPQDENRVYPSQPGQRPSNPTLYPYQYTIPNDSGIWSNYFEPVSNFQPGSCPGYPLVEIDPFLVSPGLDTYCPWSIRSWRYDNVPSELWWSPNTTALSSVSVTTTPTTRITATESSIQPTTIKEWYRPYREEGHSVVQKYYKFQPYIIRRAEQVNPINNNNGNNNHDASTKKACLGIHLRNSDKHGKYRKKVNSKFFVPYINAYIQSGGRNIYLATDSHKAYHFIMSEYNKATDIQINSTTHAKKKDKQRHKRYNNVTIWSQGQYVVRSHKEYPAHFLEQHHQVNSEVLVDIVALSYCQILLHTYSTVAEAAMYLNPALHNNSVNLEDPDRIPIDQYRRMVSEIISAPSRT